MLKKFNKYFNKFDTSDSNIFNKYTHSLRVAAIIKDMAEHLELDKEDIELSFLIGLFHDIGRFKQWEKYKTYKDEASCDHGDLSCEILEEEGFLDEMDFEDRYILLKAIKNHNKYKIEDGLDERTLFFCKLIKDADKVDILNSHNVEVPEDDIKITDEFVNAVYGKRLFRTYKEMERYEFVYKDLCFVYDFYFDYSKTLISKNRIKKMFNGVRKKCDDIKLLNELENEVLDYLG